MEKALLDFVSIVLGFILIGIICYDRGKVKGRREMLNKIERSQAKKNVFIDAD